MGQWPFNRRRPRLRRFGKWAGLGVVLLLAAVHITSLWWGVLWGPVWPWRDSTQVEFGIRSGRLFAQWCDEPFMPTPRHPLVYRHDEPVNWELEWNRWLVNGFPVTYALIPLWLPALLVTVPTAWLWWRDRPSQRRMLAGQCSKCGYDLTGLAGKPCPECGGKSARR